MKRSIKFILFIAIIIGGLSCGKTVLEPAEAPTGPPKKEGDSLQGGIIIYVDGTGEHGLIGAKVDVFPFTTIWTTSNYNTTATSTARYGGINNTNLIVAAHGPGSYAAFSCDQYAGNGYSDWYLPSSGEMSDLYKHKTKLGLSSAYYWSSTEVSSSQAYACNMQASTGNLAIYTKSSNYRIRAVRKF